MLVYLQLPSEPAFVPLSLMVGTGILLPMIWTPWQFIVVAIVGWMKAMDNVGNGIRSQSERSESHTGRPPNRAILDQE